MRAALLQLLLSPPFLAASWISPGARPRAVPRALEARWLCTEDGVRITSRRRRERGGAPRARSAAPCARLHIVAAARQSLAVERLGRVEIAHIGRSVGACA